MLVTPALALLTLVLNFYALLHVTNNRKGLSTKGSRWQVLDHTFYGLEETTVTTHENYLDIVLPPPPSSSPLYSTALHRAEWVYRSSAVRILNLVDGSSKVQTASGANSPPFFSPSRPSPTKPTDPVAPAGHLPPTLTSPIYPATFEPFPTYDPSTPSVLTFSVAQSLGLTGLISCLVYTLVFAWMKDRRSRRRPYASRPRLRCDVNCKNPKEDFHSLYTATSIPSYPGSEAKFSKLKSEGPSGRYRNSHIGFPTTSRTFPVLVTGSDGKTLFNAEIKLSSNHVTTELSATTSTVSFSIDVVASLDVPSVTEWYMPGKEDNGNSAQVDDSTFVLLVRGSSDRLPPVEVSQDSDYTSGFEDILVANQTPTSAAQTLVSDCEVEGTYAHDVPPLGSPMCAITIPIHYRGFSSFETALINSGTETRRANTSHRSGARPNDIPFAWIKDVYTCGDGHLTYCSCEGAFGENARDEFYLSPSVMSEIYYDHDADPELNRETHSEERGSGMRNSASTVSPGSSVRSEMFPTSISGPAEPRLTARSDPSLADGKEPAGLDSTVALMPSFSVGSPGLPPRCRSSGISTAAEFSGGAFGEQSVSSEADDAETGSTGECTGVNRFANGIRSPPSPVIPAQASSLLDALGPILTDYTCPPSPEEAALMHPSFTFNRPESPPIEYSPTVRAYSPVSRPITPEYGDWIGESTGIVGHVDLEPALAVEPQPHIHQPSEAAATSTPQSQ